MRWTAFAMGPHIGLLWDLTLDCCGQGASGKSISTVRTVLYLDCHRKRIRQRSRQARGTAGGTWKRLHTGPWTRMSLHGAGRNCKLEVGADVTIFDKFWSQGSVPSLKLDKGTAVAVPSRAQLLLFRLLEVSVNVSTSIFSACPLFASLAPSVSLRQVRTQQLKYVTPLELPD